MPRILVISPTPSHPQNAGNRARIFRLLSILKEAGHHIHFLFIKQESGDRDAMAACWDSYSQVTYRMPWWARKLACYNSRCHGLAGLPIIPFPIDAWYCSSITDKIRQIIARHPIDAVIVEYVFFSKVLDLFEDRVLKIIDTHDLFGDRHKLFIRNNEPPAFFYTTPRQEGKGLNRADVVLAIQGREHEILAQRTRAKVTTVGHITAPPQPPATYSVQQPGILLFVASHNPINITAHEWFMAKIFPAIQARIPVVLHLAGNICNRVADHPRVHKLGEVEDLATCYRQADLLINPIRFGSGLKIKTIEAMGYGKPIVTTSAGADGLEEARPHGLLVGDTPTAFADHVCRLLTDPASYNTTSSQAHAFVCGYNQANRQRLLDIFAGV